MRLFHLTGEACWAAIMLDGEILSLQQKEKRYGFNPQLKEEDERLYALRPEQRKFNELHDSVVWLTSNGAPRQQWMLGAFTNNPLDKGAIRIEVEVPDAIGWPLFAIRHGFPSDFRKALNKTGGGEERLWYVVERPIPESEWVQVVRHDGLVLWDRHPESDPVVSG